MKLKTLAMVGGTCVLALGAVAMQPGGDTGKNQDSKLIQSLPKSKQTLEAGIKQAAAKAPAAAISAKFELEDKGQLSLSVYVAEKGLGVNAEQNVFKELGGSPESENWTPETEVFKDVEHVARSAEQLTVMAISKLSLTDIIKKSEKDQPGTIYSVTPTVRDHKAVFVVLVAAKDKSVTLTYDALTGQPVRGSARD